MKDKAKALLVESDLTVQCLIEGILAERGYQVTACSDRETAWTLIQQDCFPLILLGRILSDSNGLQLCRRIRSWPAGQHSTILVLTPSDDPDALTAILDAGATDYIRTPDGLRRLGLRLAFIERQRADRAERQGDLAERMRLLEEAAELQVQQAFDRITREIVSVVAHEFRTPLAALFGFSELLLTDEPPPADRRQWLQTMHEQALRLSQLVDNIVAAATLESPPTQLRLQPVDLTVLVGLVCAAVGSRSAIHRLDQQYQQPLPRALADPDLLRQVLSNVVANAIRFSPHGAGGRARRRAGPGHPRRRAPRAGRVLRVSCAQSDAADRGRPRDPADRPAEKWERGRQPRVWGGCLHHQAVQPAQAARGRWSAGGLSTECAAANPAMRALEPATANREPVGANGPVVPNDFPEQPCCICVY